MNYIVPLLCLLLILNGCKTIDGEPEGTAVAASIGDSRSLTDSLPPSLWSPSRRKINANYYFLVGEYQSFSGNHNSARQMYELAYNLDPSPLVGTKLISAADLTGHRRDALLHAKKMVLLYPKHPAVNNLYGQILFKQGISNQAEAQFKKAIRLDPSLLSAHIGLIGVRRAKGRIKSAISAARALVKKNPNFAAGWNLLSHLLISRDRKRSALKSAKRAYDLSPRVPENILTYAFLLEVNGKGKDAAKLYEDLFRYQPDNDLLIQRMVGLYRRLGNLDDALSLVRRSLRRSSSSGLHLQEGLILFELKRYGKAAKVFDALAEGSWKPDRFSYLAGISYERLGDAEKARAHYERIRVESPVYISGNFRIFKLFREAKQYQAAFEVSAKVVQTDHERAREFYILGALVLNEAKDLKRAVKFLEAGSGRYPKEISILFNLGAYYEKAGQRDLSIKVMRKIIDLNPRHHAALNFLGYLYAERGENLEEAISLINRALAEKPGDGYYLDSLGWAFFHQGDVEKARDILIRALEAAPGEGVIHEHLGDVYDDLDQGAEAVEHYKKALISSSEEKDKKRINKKLEAYED